ncbi:MAG: hypothetical protein K0S79_1912 [Nitrospira sp.]|nr:hypothetical protein [Nitrospira sp.]
MKFSRPELVRRWLTVQVGPFEACQKGTPQSSRRVKNVKKSSKRAEEAQ